MGTSELVKRNVSGMQVIKTLQVLLEDNYTMAELIERLNENEKEPIFNNSVVSKYINTCRYCGVEIPKIHNKYIVVKLPFGMNFSTREFELIEGMQKIAFEKLTDRHNNLFNKFLKSINKFSSKSIIKVEPKTIEMAFELFEKAIKEERQIRIMFKTKAILDCIPISIYKKKEKNCFKVNHNGKIRNIVFDRVSGLELLGKVFKGEDSTGQVVVYKLKGNLAQNYTLRDCEKEINRKVSEYVTISNTGEDKTALLSRLLRYDKSCEILSPKEYRDEMKTILDEMLKNYGEY